MGSDSAFGENFYISNGKCHICGQPLSTNWRGEEQYYENCPHCHFTGDVDEDGYEHWINGKTGEIVRAEFPTYDKPKKCEYCQSKEVLNYEELGTQVSDWDKREKGGLVLVQRVYDYEDNWPRGPHYVHYMVALNEDHKTISESEIEYCPKCGRNFINTP